MAQWIQLHSQYCIVKGYSPTPPSPPPEVWVQLHKQDLSLTGTEVTPPVGWIQLHSQYLILKAIEIPPVEYNLIQHTEYPRGETYIGKAEQCTFEFKLYPEQIPGVTWLGTRVANTFASEVTKHGAEMLDLKIYEDTSPMFWTNYRVIATATASPIPWAIIIPAVLLILFIVALTFLIKEIKTVDWGKHIAAIPIIAIILGVGALAALGIAAAAKKKR